MIRVALVTENNREFLNQVRLCLFSLRKNGGLLADAPVHLISIGKPLSKDIQADLQMRFGFIEFSVAPKIHGCPPANKLNIFSHVPIPKYENLLYLDCDTVVLGPLDELLYPMADGTINFMARRGGESDRACFKDYEGILHHLQWIPGTCHKVGVQEERTLKEPPMFNTGVMMFTNLISQTMGYGSRDILHRLCHKHELMKRIGNSWMREQCAVSLAATQEDVRPCYLPERFNTWGNAEDARILHCFKSRYKFRRPTMFDRFDRWRGDHENSEYPAERQLVEIVESYIKEHHEHGHPA